MDSRLERLHSWNMSLDRIFDELEIDADPFALCELKGQCVLGLGRQPIATLHYFLSGKGAIVFEGQAPVPVEAGTLVLAPAHMSHTLKNNGDPGTPLPECHPAELDLLRFLAEAKDAVGTKPVEEAGKLIALCGHVRVGLRGIGGIVDLVREPIVERISTDTAMAGAVDSLMCELAGPKLGSKAMIRALLLQCMIHLLRSRLLAQDRALGWMAALIDEKLWAALRTMLDAPGDRHSVESLADAVGMSRSTFAKRFSDAYGAGPMDLLRDLRMNLAASLLLKSDLPVKRVTELVGYQSRSYFSRAFESHFGVSPSEFRDSGQST